MEHIAWKVRIKPGCKAEYQRRHAEIWPEMVEVLKAAGICNYSIFYCNDEAEMYHLPCGAEMRLTWRVRSNWG